MDRRRQGRGFCRDIDSWLSGPSKSIGWGGAHGLIGCRGKFLRERDGLGKVFTLLLAWYEGGYQNSPILVRPPQQATALCR